MGSAEKNQTKQIFNEKAMEFGVDLFTKVVQTEKWFNIMISPLSVHSALSLMYLTVGPNTRKEMTQSVRLFDDKETNIKILARTLCEYSKSKHVHLGCKLFVEKSLKIKPGALATLGKLSKAVIHRIDFRNTKKASRTINNWVEKKTKNKIKDITDADNLINVKLIIVSAIYFNIPWKLPFGIIKSYDGEFWKNGLDKIPVRMMRQDFMEIDYIELPELKCRAITLPFEDGDHYMLIALPDSKTGIDSLEADLSRPEVNLMHLKGSWGVLVHVQMPSFRFEFSSDLIKSLEKMGMKTTFKNPDFSELFEHSQGFFIDKVFHKTIIHVDENGVEAAAATSIGGATSDAEDRDFIVSHPFLFAIMGKHKRLLFIGTVRDPSCTTECRMN